jgi:hypothetical protein
MSRVVTFDVAAGERLRAARAALKHPPIPLPGKPLVAAPAAPEPAPEDLAREDWEQRRKRLRRVIVQYRTAADKRRIVAKLRDRALYTDGFVMTWDEAMELTHDPGVAEVQIRRPGLR